tara:strand:+ start:1427 stop:1609 length:183 start_codon:yes stop_codon:yes gene_type:complete
MASDNDHGWYGDVAEVETLLCPLGREIESAEGAKNTENTHSTFYVRMFDFKGKFKYFNES